jgi:hypothetical protein
MFEMYGMDPFGYNYEDEVIRVCQGFLFFYIFFIFFF